MKKKFLSVLLIVAVLIGMAGVSGTQTESGEQKADKERNQFIGIEDGRIVAAYIMNHDRDEAYHAVKWLIDAKF